MRRQQFSEAMGVVGAIGSTQISTPDVIVTNSIRVWLKVAILGINTAWMFSFKRYRFVLLSGSLSAACVRHLANKRVQGK